MDRASQSSVVSVLEETLKSLGIGRVRKVPFDPVRMCWRDPLELTNDS